MRHQPQNPSTRSRSSQPELTEIIAAKKQKVAEFQKKQTRIDSQRVGWYAEFSDLAGGKDLLKYIDFLAKSFNDSARSGVGMVDGKNIQLTPEQRISMLDKASGLDMIVLYLNKYLPEKKKIKI